MPSKSKAQQKFMGIVHAFNKGELKGSEVSKQVKDVAKSMKKKDTKDFAKTKHKGLPNKVTQEWLKKTIRELVDEELNLEGTCGYGEDGVLGDEPAGPHLLKKKKNESASEKKKIHALMVKRGNNPKDAQDSLDKVYDFIKKAYRKASVAKKAEIVSSLSKYESKQFKKMVVSEGVRATKAYNQFQKSRINFLERWGKLKKQLNTLKTESPNDEYLRLEKQLYKFETSFIENSAKMMSSLSKISKSNLTESVNESYTLYHNGRPVTGFYTNAFPITKVVGTSTRSYISFKSEKSIKDDFKRVLSDVSKDDRFTKQDVKKLATMFKKMKIRKNESVNEEVTKSKGVEKIFDIQKNGYGKLGGRTLDSLSAGLFTQLYDKASDPIKEKMNKLNEKKLYIVIGNMWKKFGKNVSLR